jgi:Flp pilus assembly protein TadD
MTVTVNRIGIASVLACVLAVGASCTQHKPDTKPGGLPQVTTDGDAPKLNATTYLAHGHLLERQGAFEKAELQYRKALDLQPDFVTARNRLGITLNQLGRHEEASEQFTRALRLQPGEAYLYNNLGFSLLLEGKLPEAEQAIRRALELKPNFPRASMNLGVVLARASRNDESIVAFEQATDEASAYYNLAVVQSELGRYSDAVRSLDTALRINPLLDVARAHLQEIAQLAATQEPQPRETRVLQVTAESQPQPAPPAASGDYSVIERIDLDKQPLPPAEPIANPAPAPQTPPGNSNPPPSNPQPPNPSPAEPAPSNEPNEGSGTYEVIPLPPTPTTPGSQPPGNPSAGVYPPIGADLLDRIDAALNAAYASSPGWERLWQEVEFELATGLQTVTIRT